MSESTLTLFATGEPPAEPRLDEAAAELLRQGFIDTVTALSLANGNRSGWWFTWLSSRDRFNAKAWQRMVALARLSERLKQNAPQRLGCADPWLADALADLARRRGWRVRRSAGDRLRWTARRFVPSGWLAAFKELARGTRLLLAARKHPKAIPAAEVVLVGPLSLPPLRQAGPYRDPYFGQLPQALSERSLHFGDVQGEAGIVVEAAAARTDPILTLGHLLNWGDLAAAALAAARPLRAVPAPLPWGGDSRSMLADDLRHARGQIVLGTLMERATARLLAALPGARIIHTYENNPWERGVDRAAHAAGRHAIGYLHCAVLRAHMKNIITKTEQNLRPAPDRIVCTGPSARGLFLSLGAHNPDTVFPGCALRGPSLAGLPCRATPPQQPRTLLALLEGLPSMIQVLHLLEQAARLSPELRILVRAHPSLPLSVLAPQAGVKMGELLHESAPSDMMQALAEADVVVYQGTTAAMTALYCGIPLVRLRLDDTVDDDPLSACPHLKAEIDHAAELAPALARFAALGISNFEAEVVAARAWIDGAMAPPNGSSLAGFRR